MTSKELVLRAIEFNNPPRVPIFMFNRDFDKTDILIVGANYAPDFKPKEEGLNEWGWKLTSTDDTMGQVEKAPIRDWSDMADFQFPNGKIKERFAWAKKVADEHKDLFIIGNLGMSGFTQFTFVRGFSEALTDFYLEEENTNYLLDKIFDFECDIINGLIDAGADAISFYDDWGTQNSLFISLEMWKKFFYARYKRQFDLIHSRGKKVFFHSCGNVLSIIPSLIELGADMVNFNGLEVLGFEKVEKFSGKICFCCPVDLQSVAIKADKATLYEYTQKMISWLGNKHGGYIGYVEEYHSIGLSDENYWHCYNALKELGKYER